MRYIIGVDLGGTQLRAALAGEHGQIVAEVRQRTATGGGQAVIDQIDACIAQVRAALPASGDLLGIGIGAPGPLDPYEGVVLTPPNLPGWGEVHLRAAITARSGLPVELGNDANAAALGEWMFGAGRGRRNLVYLTISTGIGGGVIADGRLLLGRRGAAAEVGLHIVDPVDLHYWEELASGTALGRAAAAAMPAEPGSLLHTLASADTVSAADVAHAAAAGDALALRLMDREGELIGLGLVNMLHLFSPEVILIGGSVAIHNPSLLDRARQVILARAHALYHEVPVELAALGDRAGILGAVALFLHMREARA